MWKDLQEAHSEHEYDLNLCRDRSLELKYLGNRQGDNVDVQYNVDRRGRYHQRVCMHALSYMFSGPAVPVETNW
jgi:hypothetical protein